MSAEVPGEARPKAAPGEPRLKPTAPALSLTTDFGLLDPFVGLMHAVIAKACPALRVIDLCHAVPPQNVEVACFWLQRCIPYFPEGSVHLCVVDPTVGSSRPVVVGRWAGGWLIGPDNGCLPAPSGATFRRLDQPARWAPGELSATFHGRDLFAPLAAAIAAGRCSFEQLGPVCATTPPAYRPAQPSGSQVAGRVVAVDHFGNLLTNLERTLWDGAAPARVRIAERELPLVRCYADLPAGKLAALFNSQGVLEVACNCGNAAEELSVAAGASVILDLAPASNRP